MQSEEGNKLSREIGERLRCARHSKELSLGQLSSLTGGALAKSRFSNYELGIRRMSIEAARLLAEALARCAACGHDFLVAFSCKGRGLCPSCTTRRMAATAAHLVDQAIPPLPVCQWGDERPRPVDNRSAPNGRTGYPDWNDPPGMVPTA